MFVGLFVLLAQDVPTVQLPLEFSSSDPAANLFFLNPGFLDPSRSSGIVGADLNPAALGFMKNSVDFYVAGTGGSTQKTGMSLEIPVNSGDETVAQVPVDLDASFTDMGGFDYLGIGTKIGPFALGLIYQRSSSLQIGLPEGFSFSTSISSDSLTSFDYGYEYQAGDTLPLRLTISGQAAASLHPVLSGELSQQPLFLGGAFRLGPLSVGLGYKHRKYTAEFNAVARVSLDSGSIGCRPSADGWNTDSLNVSLQLPQDDSLFYASYTGTVSGQQNAVVAGAVLQPLKFLGISLAGEMGLRSQASSVYTRTIYLPDTISGSLDIVEDNVNVDPGSQTASGSLVLSAPGLVKRVDQLQDANSYDLLSYYALRAGVNFFIINLGGGVEFTQTGTGIGTATNYITPSIGIPLPKSELRIGSVVSWRYMQVGDYTVPSLPMMYAGAGFTLKPDLAMGPVVLQEMAVGARASLMSYGLSVMSSGMTGQDINLDSYMPSLAVNAGLRLGVRIPRE